MLASIQFNHWSSFTPLCLSFPNINHLISEITKQIKAIALTIFAKISEGLRTFNNQSNEINLKTIAMVSCLSLIALLVISILRRHDNYLRPASTA